MKHIYYNTVIFAALLIGAASCNKAEFLDRAPYTRIAPENFFQTEAQVRMALVGAYEAMNTHQVGGKTVSGGTYYCGLMQMMSAPSDEILTSQNASDSYGAYTDMIRSNFTESTPCLRRFWDAFYVGINRCNSVINNIDKAGEVKKRDMYIAEARFMRAFYYWYLAQFFGGVPIAQYQGDGQEPRSSLKDVYTYILTDLEEAYLSMAETRDGGILGTSSANKYTAAAYIGRICNYLAACKRNNVGAEFVAEQPLNDFSWVDADAMTQKAYTYLKDVIENSPYVLIDDFRNLFRETTKEDQHKECLFLAENYLDGTENVYPTIQVFGFTPSCTANKENGTTGSVWGNYVIASAKMFEMFSPKDPRRDWYFVGKGNGSLAAGTLKEETVEGYKYVIPFNRTSIVNDDSGEAATQTFFLNNDANCCGKYRFVQVGQITTHGESMHGMSIPLMRLADVYLMYAEAIYFKDGDESLAREQFKTVLLRAVAGDETLATELMGLYHKDDFLTELLETRERELCFEGSRKYDLMRFGIMDKTIYDFANTPIAMDGETPRYYYDTYFRFADKQLCRFSNSSTKTGVTALKDNWQPYKIWCPISSLQIAANPNLTQNAKW